MTKEQLGRIVKQQSAQLAACVEERTKLVDLLLAIAKHPEAFSYDGQVAVIDRGAVLKVQRNTTLTVKRRGERVELHVTSSRRSRASRRRASCCRHR